jgi:isopropylmalate/homocitrate/citramalate synthase
MNIGEKVEVARQLERLGVDVMEAGFPAASPGDLASVKAVAEVIKQSSVAALCRATKAISRRAGGRWKRRRALASIPLSPPRRCTWNTSSK